MNCLHPQVGCSLFEYFASHACRFSQGAGQVRRRRKYDRCMWATCTVFLLLHGSPVPTKCQPEGRNRSAYARSGLDGSSSSLIRSYHSDGEYPSSPFDGAKLNLIRGFDVVTVCQVEMASPRVLGEARHSDSTTVAKAVVAGML
jgi:hypothetical protein